MLSGNATKMQRNRISRVPRGVANYLMAAALSAIVSLADHSQYFDHPENWAKSKRWAEINTSAEERP